MTDAELFEEHTMVNDQPTLRGGVVLAPPRPDDAPLLAEAAGDPDTRSRFCWQDIPAEEAWWRTYIDEVPSGWWAGERAIWAVREQEAGELIGLLQMRTDQDRLWTTTMTMPAHRGRGVAQRARGLLFGWLIELGAKELWSAAESDNLPALAILDNEGFAYVGAEEVSEGRVREFFVLDLAALREREARKDEAA